jgi:hypothetical protein
MTTPKYLTVVEEDALVAAAVAAFPGEFTLRGFPGERFRVSPSASYYSAGGGDYNMPSTVYLYTERLTEDGTWRAFAKGTPAELRREIGERLTPWVG